MKRKKFSGIFAAVFVAATVITLASCSQDDEYYEDGLFTRADEMMTRTEGPDKYDIRLLSGSDTLMVSIMDGTEDTGLKVSFNITWQGGLLKTATASVHERAIYDQSATLIQENPLRHVKKYRVSGVYTGHEAHSSMNNPLSSQHCFIIEHVIVYAQKAVFKNGEYVYENIPLTSLNEKYIIDNSYIVYGDF